MASLDVETNTAFKILGFEKPTAVVISQCRILFDVIEQVTYSHGGGNLVVKLINDNQPLVFDATYTDYIKLQRALFGKWPTDMETKVKKPLPIFSVVLGGKTPIVELRLAINKKWWFKCDDQVCCYLPNDDEQELSLGDIAIDYRKDIYSDTILVTLEYREESTLLEVYEHRPWVEEM